MAERWELVLELTFEVKPEDIEKRFEGDTEKDFSSRALERIRPDLNDFIYLNEGQFAHYHIISMPKRVED